MQSDILVALAYLLPFLSLTGLALSGVRWLSLSPAMSLLPAASTATVLVYVGAIFLGPAPAAAITIATGLGLLLWNVARAPAQTRAAAVHPEFLLFVALLVLLAIGSAEAQFLAWDEFSHWGLVSKFVSETGRLPSAPGEVNFLDYPVAPALFHYVLTFGAPFSESRAIFAQGAFVAAALMPMIRIANWRDPLPLLLAVPIVLFSGFLLSETGHWNNVLVDGLLSTAAAGAFVIYRFGEHKVRSLAAALVVTLALPLFKDIGLILAMAVIGLIAVDMVVITVRCRTFPLTSAAVLALGLGMLAILKAIQQSYIDRHAIITNFSITPERIRERLAWPDFPLHFEGVTQAFASAFFGMPLGPIGMPAWGWLVVLLGLSLVTTINAPPGSRTRAGVLSLTWAAAFVAYSATLFILYVFAFSVYEGAGVASFARYMGGFLEIWLLTAVASVILQRSSTPDVTGIASLVAVLSLSVWSFVVSRLAAGDLMAHPNSALLVDRQEVKSKLGDGQFSPPRDARVYSLWNGTSGLRHFMTVFELSPRPVNFWYYSLGPSRFPGDVWSAPWTVSELLQTYRDGGYDYLFIGQSDETFWQTYDAAFRDGTDAGTWFTLDIETQQFVPVALEQE